MTGVHTAETMSWHRGWKPTLWYTWLGNPARMAHTLGWGVWPLLWHYDLGTRLPELLRLWVFHLQNLTLPISGTDTPSLRSSWERTRSHSEGKEKWLTSLKSLGTILGDCSTYITTIIAGNVGWSGPFFLYDRCGLSENRVSADENLLICGLSENRVSCHTRYNKPKYICSIQILV